MVEITKEEKRITILVTPKKHAEIKKRAIDADLTMTQWIYAAIKLLSDAEDRKNGKKAI